MCKFTGAHYLPLSYYWVITRFLSEISKIYTALCWLKDKQLEVLSPDGINKAIYVYLMNRSLFALSESKSQAAARDQARKSLVCSYVLRDYTLIFNQDNNRQPQHC